MGNYSDDVINARLEGVKLVLLHFKVRPEVRDDFMVMVKRKCMNKSEALREALTDWMQKQETIGTQDMFLKLKGGR